MSLNLRVGTVALLLYWIQWHLPKTVRRGEGFVAENILTTPLAAPTFEFMAMFCLLHVFYKKPSSRPSTKSFLIIDQIFVLKVS